jgi:nucleoside transporter
MSDELQAVDVGNAPAAPGRMRALVLLSIMMFLEFFIWGAWYVTVTNYMKAEGMGAHVSWAFSVGPIAAIISPFFLGMVADRFFASERVLAVMQLLGGAALLAAPYFTPGEGGSYWPFIGILLVHMLFYMPTLGLTNTVAFHNLTNRERQFPIVRVFGTIGWIVANFVVSDLLHADNKPDPFYIAGGAALLLGVFSFMLPHTPAPAKGKAPSIRDVLGLDALVLMKDRSFSVFIISSFLICIPLAAYYAFAPAYVGAAGFVNPAGTMKFGQVAEVVFMLIMPLCFVRLGVKWMLLVGMFAWVLRYGLFAAAADDGVRWMILGGILLHGICYDFFFVTGFIYVDKKATQKGLGMLIGAQLFGIVVNKYTQKNQEALVKQANDLKDQALAATGAHADELWQQWHQTTEMVLHAANWQTIWLIPCIMAAVVAIGFLILFKNKGKRAAGGS